MNNMFLIGSKIRVVNKTIQIYATPAALWWFIIVCAINIWTPNGVSSQIGSIDAFPKDPADKSNS